MRAEGLEPPRLAAPAPKAGVSANSTTPARAPSYVTPSAAPRYQPTRWAEDESGGRGPCHERMFARASDGISYNAAAGGTGLMATTMVSKTIDWGSIPWSPADSPL